MGAMHPVHVPCSVYHAHISPTNAHVPWFGPSPRHERASRQAQAPAKQRPQSIGTSTALELD